MPAEMSTEMAHIGMHVYPPARILRNSLIDGSGTCVGE